MSSAQPQTIRLFIVTHYLDKGGVEEVILMHAKFLDKQKYEIMVACRSGGMTADEIVALGVPVRYFESASTWGRLINLWTIAKQFKPDIVHNHFTWHGLIVGFFLRVPRIETIHNTYDWFVGMQRIAYGVYCRLASKIVAVSEHVRRFTIDFFPFVDQNNIVVIHNGIDTRRFHPSIHQNQLRPKLGLSPTDVVIGFIGRLEEQKGISYLLQALSELNVQKDRVKLVIVGNGTLKDDLQKQADTLGLSNVLFVGFQRDTPQYLQMFDIFVLPSLFEGLPVSIIEAMAAGCAVVVTRIGGVDEVVEHEVTGLVVEPKHPGKIAEAVRRLIDDPELRRQLGQQARRHVEREFSVEGMLAKTERMYHELIVRS